LLNLSGSEELQEFGNSKIKLLFTHFRKMLVCDGKDKKMPSDILDVFLEFRVVAGQNSPLPNQLKKNLYKLQISYAKRRAQHFYGTANVNKLM
jgi:hypothetical protein